MNKSNLFHLVVVVLILSIVGLVGCSGNEDVIGPAPFPKIPEVFLDQFGNSVGFEAFLGSKLDAVQTTQIASEIYQGLLGMVVTVPDSGSADGSYAGGAFTASIARNLTDYNAITFWAKADKAVTLNVAGIGNDNTGNSLYTAETNNLALTTSWQKYIIPIPLSEKLTIERGLFYFAEGPEGGIGSQIFIDEVTFEYVSNITNPRPVITPEVFDVEIGETITPSNGIVIFDVGGIDINVSAMPDYFTFTSSNTSIVSVDPDGVIRAVGVGTATLTAKLGTTTTTGSITVNVTAPLAVPTSAAPSPTVDPLKVVSLFSDTYANATVDLWSTDWDDTQLEDIVIGSNNVKKYYDLSFAGIEFSSSPIDASSMTRFHMDVWTPNLTTAPTEFKVKLIDFGIDGVFGGGDDVEHELSFDDYYLSTENWFSIDVPLSAFTNLTTTGHLAQMIISGDLTTIYVDNIYFYDAGLQTAPLNPAPIPVVDPLYVVSLYSDAYSSAADVIWSVVWDNATVEDFTIGTNSMKKYTDLVFAGIDFRNNTLDATGMTHFHMDIWTPDPTVSPSIFKVKLVDFGPDGVSGGGDDVEDEIMLNHFTLRTGLWVGIDIPLSDFSGLTTSNNIGQIILTSDPSTVFVDNIYLYDSGIPTVPPVPAPIPTVPAVDVISLFSDAYNDVPVDTWSTPWDSAGVQDYLIGTDSTKKYVTLLFAGIEFTSPTIDATAMTHFHMDVWTPDPTNAPATFEIKLVDFGADGVWNDPNGGGPIDDVEHEIILDENIMNSNSWVSIELPLSDFTNLTTRGHLAQLIITCDPNTVYVDNVYFHK